MVQGGPTEVVVLPSLKGSAAVLRWCRAFLHASVAPIPGSLLPLLQPYAVGHGSAPGAVDIGTFMDFDSWPVWSREAPDLMHVGWCGNAAIAWSGGARPEHPLVLMGKAACGLPSPDPVGRPCKP